MTGRRRDDSLDDGDQDPYGATDPGPTLGNDTLDGGPGRDTLYVGRGTDDVHGGDGEDSVSMDRGATLPADAPAGATPGPLNVRLSNDDVADDGVIGSGENDNVHADVEDLFGGDGDDTLVGGPGPDTLVAGAGSDTLTGGGGADALFGGSGDDTLLSQDGVTDTLSCGRGTDTATVDLPGGQPERADVLGECETVGGTPFPALPGPADTTPPALTVKPPKRVKVKAFLQRGTLSLGVSTTEPASVQGTVLAPGVKLRAVGDLEIGSGSLGAGTGVRTLKVKVAKVPLKALKRKLRTKRQVKRGVRLRVLVVATDAAGLRTSRTVAVRVRG